MSFQLRLWGSKCRAGMGRQTIRWPMTRRPMADMGRLAAAAGAAGAGRQGQAGGRAWLAPTRLT